MIPFSFRQLEAFIWVAALGNFRKAAERLNTTQPSISSRISTLEDLIGRRLFERGAGSVRLSADGQALLPTVKKLIQLAESVDTRAGAGTRREILRLGVAETVVHSWLPIFLKRFSSTYPLVDVDVVVDVTVDLRDELIQHGLDLAFLMGPISEYRVENIDLPAFPLAWVCSPSLPLARRTPLGLDDLADYPIITYARTTRPYAELHRKLTVASDKIPRLFPVSSLSATLRMALDGVGVATLPISMIGDHVSEGALTTLDCDWTPSELVFTASFTTDPPNATAQRAAEMARDVARSWSP